MWKVPDVPVVDEAFVPRHTMDPDSPKKLMMQELQPQNNIQTASSSRKTKRRRKKNDPLELSMTSGRVPEMSLEDYARRTVMDGLLWVPRNVPPPRVVFPLGGTDHALHSERVRTLGVVLDTSLQDPQLLEELVLPKANNNNNNLVVNGTNDDEDDGTPVMLFPETSAYFSMMRRLKQSEEEIRRRTSSHATTDLSNTLNDTISTTAPTASLATTFASTSTKFYNPLMDASMRLKSFPEHLPVRRRAQSQSSSTVIRQEHHVIMSPMEAFMEESNNNNKEVATNITAVRYVKLTVSDDTANQSQKQAMLLHHIREELFLPNCIKTTLTIDTKDPTCVYLRMHTEEAPPSKKSNRHHHEDQPIPTDVQEDEQLLERAVHLLDTLKTNKRLEQIQVTTVEPIDEPDDRVLAALPMTVVPTQTPTSNQISSSQVKKRSKALSRLRGTNNIFLADKGKFKEGGGEEDLPSTPLQNDLAQAEEEAVEDAKAPIVVEPEQDVPPPTNEIIIEEKIHTPPPPTLEEQLAEEKREAKLKELLSVLQEDLTEVLEVNTVESFHVTTSAEEVFELDQKSKIRAMETAYENGDEIPYPKCDQCEEQSWWWCEECGLYTCLLCDAALHIGRMMSQHAKALLPGRKLVKAKDPEPIPEIAPIDAKKSESNIIKTVRNRAQTMSNMKNPAAIAAQSNFNLYMKGAAKFLSASATVKKNPNKFVITSKAIEEDVSPDTVTAAWDSYVESRRQRPYHAIVISVSHFYDNYIVPLPIAARDGLTVRDMFLSQGYSVEYLCDNAPHDFLVPTMKNVTRILETARAKVPTTVESLLVVYIISRGVYGVCQGLSQKDNHLIMVSDTILKNISSRTCLNVDKLCFDRDAAGHKALVMADCWAMPAVPFGTTIPALGFAYMGGRTAATGELAALYSRAVPGGVFTYYFLKGSQGYCIRQYPGRRRSHANGEVDGEAGSSTTVNTGSLCAYIASKLQQHCDCTVQVDIAHSLLLYPNFVAPMARELKEAKQASMMEQVRLHIITQGRGGDGGKFVSLDSPDVWKFSVWKTLLKTLCGIEEPPVTNTTFPFCPLRIAFMEESTSSLVVKLRDTSDMIREEQKYKAFDAEVMKSLATVKMSTAKGQIQRPPWYQIRATDSQIEFTCHQQADLLKTLRHFFINGGNGLSRKPQGVYTEVQITVVTSQYLKRRLDKMFRLGTFTKFFPIVDMFEDAHREADHIAALFAQKTFRRWFHQRKYMRQKAILDEEDRIRDINATLAHAQLHKIRLLCLADRIQVYQAWESVQRLELERWSQTSLKGIMTFAVKNLQTTEESRRTLLVFEMLEMWVGFEEVNYRHAISSHEEYRRRRMYLSKKMQETQHWERYYVMIQEFQNFLSMRNMARFNTRVNLQPPPKPIQPKAAAPINPVVLPKVAVHHKKKLSNTDDDTPRAEASRLKLNEMVSEARRNSIRRMMQGNAEKMPVAFDVRKRNYMRDVIKGVVGERHNNKKGGEVSVAAAVHKKTSLVGEQDAFASPGVTFQTGAKGGGGGGVVGRGGAQRRSIVGNHLPPLQRNKL